MQLPDMNKRKILSNEASVGNIQKQTEDRFFLSYPILCPLCHPYQRKKIKNKFTQLRIDFNVGCQLHIVGEKKSSTQRGHLIDQVHSTAVKWSIKPRIV